MKKLMILVVVVLLAVNVASATVVQGIDIDFVTIGNPGNPGDPRVDANPSNCGAVDYEYQIGKYEVTNGQWDSFVSAAGAPTGNYLYRYDENTFFTGSAIPTTGVSWYEAAQFCNYLTSGDKSQGAYQFSGDNINPLNFVGINRESAISTYGIAYVIPTEGEWHKAAYYTGSEFSIWPNGQTGFPLPTPDNGFNGYGGSYSSPWDVGTGSEEQNGTFDMVGNVWEWTESWTLSDNVTCRGASFISYSTTMDVIFSNVDYGPSSEGYSLGFRIASVPEPCSLVLLSLGGLMLRRKR